MTRPRPLIRSLCAVLAMWCNGACGTAARPKPEHDGPRVVKWQPGDELTRLDAAITLVFDRPMVSIEAVGPVLEAPDVHVEPALPLRVHWEDRRTLRVQPESEWRAGQRYALSLDGELAASTAEPHRFSFDARPLRIAWLSLGGDNAARDPELDAIFTLPVDPAEAARRCALVSADGARVGLRERARERDAPLEPQRVRFAVRTRLALQTNYRLDCSELLPLGGTAPFRRNPDDTGFTTHGKLALTRALPAEGDVLPPERATICIELTTPVDAKQLARHVKVTPAPEGLADSWYESSCDGRWERPAIASSVLLAPRRSYEVVVAPELTDRFGQKLGRAHRFRFATGDRVPGLWTATGAGSVLEYGRTGHAVGALNLREAVLRCTSLSAAQLAASFGRFSEWAFESSDVEPSARAKAPWELLGIAAKTHALDLRAAPNQERTQPIDLGARCGGASGAAGLYALELVPGERSAGEAGRQGDAPARLLANVTDLGVVAKRGEHGAVVWVTRLSTGALVAGASVEAYDAAGQRLASTRSDARGLARFAHLPLEREDHGFFAVRSGADVAVVGMHWLWRDGLQGWQLGVRESYGDERTRLFVHTDRGVYRPGERVLVHGLARETSDDAPARVPAARAVALALRAGRETLYQQSFELDDFGAFAAQIDLPAHVPPGSHALTVEVAGKSEQIDVRVAEFKPLTFELAGGPVQAELFAPETVQLDVTARYLFGAPLPSAELRFTVERTPAEVRAPDFAEFRFADSAPSLASEERWPTPPSGLVLERDGRTDAQGRARLEFASEAARQPTRYLITAAASDAARERATRSFSVLAHSADRYVGTRMVRSLFAPDEPVQAEVVLVDHRGKPVAGEVAIELRDERWQCEDPLAHCTAQVRVLETQSVRVAAERPALVTFAARASGSVHARAETRDANGRPSRASDSAFIFSGEHGSGPYGDRVAAPLGADRRAYRIGDRARVALQSALAPKHLLLTAERGDVLSAEVVTAAAGVPAIALGKAAAPNAFVTLTGMTPRSTAGEAGKPRLVSGARELAVSGPSRVLNAEIALERSEVEPGQRVAGVVRVTHLGRPVQAHVALVAVNESVLQLTAFETPDPTRVFHAPRGLGVRTASNLVRVVADPAAAARVPAVARVQQGEDGGGGRPELREDYVAAAYWAPALHTDAQGRAQFAFDAPGDLSAYRLMAVVAARDDRAGSTEARLTVKKALSARPIAPRFASRGDAFDVGALVHDQTGAAGASELRLRAQGLQLSQTTLQLPGGAAQQVAYTRAVVQDVDSAELDVEVHKGALVDRTARTLRVRRPFDTELRVLALGRAAKMRARLDWPAGVDRELSRLEVTIDRAGLAPLAPVLAAVVNYPYGCTEQTAAALSAIAAAPELASAILPELATRDLLAARVKDGFGRLLQARAPGGAFALYPGMNGRAWVTALVLEAALAARHAGLEVPESIASGATAVLAAWLAEHDLRRLSRTELELAAQSAWLLRRAGMPRETAEEQLWQARERLSIDAAARLLHALALRGGHDARRAELRARLRSASWLKRARDPLEPLVSPERTTALVLAALHADRSEPEQQARLAAWLAARAADPDVFLSTRDVADTLAALAAWAGGRQAGASRVEVGLGTQVLWEGALDGAQVVAIARTTALAPGGEVWVEADGEVSVSIRRRDVSPTAPRPAFARGLSLERRYLDPKSKRPLTEMAAGDIVQVELELRSEQAVRMVALADPMPAGLEPLDPDLSSGRVAGCEACNDNAGFDHVRRHDDRIEAFAEWLPRGTHTLRYLLRATTAGTFSAPGATAELMYLPDRHGRSNVGRVTVRR